MISIDATVNAAIITTPATAGADDGPPVVDGALRVHLFAAGGPHVPDEGVPTHLIRVVVLYRARKRHPVLHSKDLAQDALVNPATD